MIFLSRYFPSKEEYVALLESEGMQVEEASLFPRDTPVPGGPIGWLETFPLPFFADYTPDQKQQVSNTMLTAITQTICVQILNDVQAAMEPLKVDKDGNFLADYVRLRIRAIKPARNC